MALPSCITPQTIEVSLLRTASALVIIPVLSQHVPFWNVDHAKWVQPLVEAHFEPQSSPSMFRTLAKSLPVKSQPIAQLPFHWIAAETGRKS